MWLRRLAETLGPSPTYIGGTSRGLQVRGFEAVRPGKHTDDARIVAARPRGHRHGPLTVALPMGRDRYGGWRCGRGSGAPCLFARVQCGADGPQSSREHVRNTAHGCARCDDSGNRVYGARSPSYARKIFRDPILRFDSRREAGRGGGEGYFEYAVCSRELTTERAVSPFSKATFSSLFVRGSRR